ncbi:MAG: ATPase domain protein, partial [Burkholderia sp.]|nr:ATPase domain protein [Burkholderia sp.]
MQPTFKSLSISGWRQFHNIAIEFHPRLTVITGSNGAGKSSLLNLLTPHFGWQRTFLGTPKKARLNGETRYLTGVRYGRFRRKPPEPNAASEVGRVTYSNGVTGSIQVQSEVQQYNVSIANQQHVLGTFISSHRVMPTFQPIGQVGPHMMMPDHAYNMFQSEYINRFNNGHTGFSPVYRLKESLVAMALFGAKSDYSAGNDVAIENLKGFVKILHKILPPSLGFQDLSIRTTEIVLETSSGNFVLDAASGGLVALID